MKRAIIVLLCIVSVFLVSCAKKSDWQTLESGEYELNASLSCYVPAMGGVEFGEPLLTHATLKVDDGQRNITIGLAKSSVTIYSITCYTFIDATPDTDVVSNYTMPNGTIGYYDNEMNVVTSGVSYTLSQDTATNAKGNEVHYVDSITFPVTDPQEKYYLTLYINSQVMGVQFCEKSDEIKASTYSATLTVDWSFLEGFEAKADEDNGNGGKDDSIVFSIATPFYKGNIICGE